MRTLSIAILLALAAGCVGDPDDVAAVAQEQRCDPTRGDCGGDGGDGGGGGGGDTPVRCYPDRDRDGYGSATSSGVKKLTCPAGWTEDNSDCDDDNPARVYDVCQPDRDYDGFGAPGPNGRITGCGCPAGYSLNSDDCDDSRAEVQPRSCGLDPDGDGNTTPGTVCAAECPAPWSESEATLHYDQVQQRSIHNAYLKEKREGLMDQLVYYRLRNLEWDIHSESPYSFERRSNNDWYMYHVAAADQIGRCNLLSDCLKLLRAFHDAVPEHEVITIQMEFKGWGDGNAGGIFIDGDATNPYQQSPNGLDARLREHLGNALFTPADLLAYCRGKGHPEVTTLNEAVTTCGWPTLAELRGRILFTVHGWTWVDHVGQNPGERAILVDYGGESTAVAQSRAAFIAPLKLHEHDPSELASRPWIVFHTEVFGDPSSLAYLRSLWPGHVWRSPDKDDASSFHEAQTSHNFILTDHVSFHHDVDRHARTHNRFGYPFCPIGVVGEACWGQHTHALSETRERAHLLAIDVRSGDIWDQHDNFAFAFTNAPVGAGRTWSAFLSNASDSPHWTWESGIHHWAKGCLMARASLDPSAPYYAVCRAGDEEQLFIQYRSFGCSGPCGTAHASASLDHGIQAEDAIFVKLVLGPQPGGGVWAQGYGSSDGVDWQPIGAPALFPYDLPFQGLAAASNEPGAGFSDGTPTRYYFGNVLKDGVRQTFDLFPGTDTLPGYAHVGNVTSSSRTDFSYFGRPVNLAAGKPATQSNTGWGGDASRAVDGNADGNFWDSSVTHTTFDVHAWWQVDLGAVTDIGSVVLYNRTDCCGERLADFDIFLSNDGSNWWTAASFNGPAPARTALAIRSWGRFVRVQLRGTNYLSLAEVQVLRRP